MPVAPHRTTDHRGDDHPVPDLDNRAAIHDVVVAFYREVVFDDLLAPVFGEVAEVDWAEHIPKLIDYWCRILLGDANYQGSLLSSHARVHDIEPFRPEHFDRWLRLWSETVDARWQGPKADEAKQHAFKIAAVLQRRLLEPTVPSGTAIAMCEFSSNTPH